MWPLTQGQFWPSLKWGFLLYFTHIITFVLFFLVWGVISVQSDNCGLMWRNVCVEKMNVLKSGTDGQAPSSCQYSGRPCSGCRQAASIPRDSASRKSWCAWLHLQPCATRATWLLIFYKKIFVDETKIVVIDPSNDLCISRMFDFS